MERGFNRFMEELYRIYRFTKKPRIKTRTSKEQHKNLSLRHLLHNNLILYQSVSIPPPHVLSSSSNDPILQIGSTVFRVAVMQALLTYLAYL